MNQSSNTSYYIQREPLDMESNSSNEEIKDLYLKTMNEDLDNIKKLYENKSHILFKPLTPSKDTAFHIAAYMGSENLLRVLFEIVPDSKKEEALMLKNTQGNTILHEAATSGEKGAAQFLFSVKNNDATSRNMLEARNVLGETSLYRAAGIGGKKLMVKFLEEEVKKVGIDMSKQLSRSASESSDDLPILHFAVMNQKFETALWLLDQHPDLATAKDSENKTCLHLLASMPTAFKSSSQKMVHRLKQHIYNAIPEHLAIEKESEYYSTKKGIELEEKDQRQDQRGLGSRMYNGFLSCLNDGWKLVREIRETKKKHLLAVGLAKKLIKQDSSWLTYHEPKKENMVLYFTREKKIEEKKTGETNSGGTKNLQGLETTAPIDPPLTKSEKTNNGGTRNVQESTKEPDTPLIVAAKSGIKEIVDEILNEYPQALEYVTRNGQNILHVAVLHRQYEIFDRIKEEPVAKKRLALGIDDEADTVLHKAASTDYYSGGTKSTAALKLQEELKWFKDVKNRVPEHYTMHRNKNSFTAEELFKDQHKKQLNYAQEWVKNTCQSCSAVAVLVATVVYAAAFTAPGGFLESSGQPVLVQQPLYSFYTVMDVTGLATSLTSVVIFLSILTSSLDEHDFNRIIPRKLSLGFTFLFIAVTTTMLSFTATIILTVHLKRRWTTTLTYAAAFLPISVYAVVQFGLYYEYIHTAIISIFELVKKLLPGI